MDMIGCLDTFHNSLGTHHRQPTSKIIDFLTLSMHTETGHTLFRMPLSH